MSLHGGVKAKMGHRNRIPLQSQKAWSNFPLP